MTSLCQYCTLENQSKLVLKVFKIKFIIYFNQFSKLSVRDNDDLSPLFNSYTDLLKATYGDFYVAEMIEAQNEHNKCLTAEVNKSYIL